MVFLFRVCCRVAIREPSFGKSAFIKGRKGILCALFADGIGMWGAGIR